MAQSERRCATGVCLPTTTDAIRDTAALGCANSAAHGRGTFVRSALKQLAKLGVGQHMLAQKDRCMLLLGLCTFFAHSTVYNMLGILSNVIL